MSALDLTLWIGGAVCAPAIAAIVARMYWRDQREMDPVGVLCVGFALVFGFFLWWIAAGVAVLYVAFRGFAYAVRPREFKEPRRVKPKPDLDAEIARLERETGVSR